MADSPWPPTWGGAFRLSGIYEALRAHGTVLPLVLPIRRPLDEHALPAEAITRPIPLPAGKAGRLALRARSAVRGRHPFLQHALEQRAGGMVAAELERFGPEVVVLTFPFFGGFISAARRSGAVVVVDLSDLRQSIAMDQWRSSGRFSDRARGLADWLAFRRMEGEVGERADQVWFASNVDAQRFERLGMSAPAYVVPNVLQVGQYAKYRGRPHGDSCFGFVGSLDYQPNSRAAVRLLTRTLPLLREREPAARLSIIGRAPPESLVSLVAETEGAELLADVADPMTHLAEAGILVAPIEVGGGTKLKIVEAAASAIPIVTTAKGVEGMPFRAGVDFLKADTDIEIVDALLMLWRDPLLKQRLADSSLELVHAHYTQSAADQAVGRAIAAIKPATAWNA